MPPKKKSDITERSVTPTKKTKPVEMTKQNKKRASSVAPPKQDKEDKKKEESKTVPKGKKGNLAILIVQKRARPRIQALSLKVLLQHTSFSSRLM